MTDYKIIRFRRNKRSRTIKSGLSLKEAQAHCSKKSTHGEGWFDGYTSCVPKKSRKRSY